MSELIRLAVSGHVAELVLNRPERRNALSLEMWTGVQTLVAEAEADTGVKVIILHGGEAGAFAAGADISEFATAYATPDDARRSGATIAAALDALETCRKPTIAAIEGACVGGGVSLAMACDLRIGCAGSRYGVTPAKLGLVYPAGDTRRLVQAVGLSAAKDLLLTGRIVSADDALEMRVIDRLVPRGEARTAARELADEIAGNSQWSIRAIKQMIRGILGGWRDDDPAAAQLFVDGFANPDFEDGYRAFLEKRTPNYTVK